VHDTHFEGLYGGTLTGGNWPAFQLLILDNGDFWAMYGQVNSDNLFEVAGFMQGPGTAGVWTFQSNDARDFGSSPALQNMLSVQSNIAGDSISGTLWGAVSALSLTGGPLASGHYDYARPALQSSLTGNWMLQDKYDKEYVSVAADGSFTGSTDYGCSFSGTLTPRPGGKNVFVASVTFGAAPCGLPEQTATGIALEYPTNAGADQLLVAVVDGTRQNGVIAIGGRN
jgi:hypothetical protein